MSGFVSRQFTPTSKRRVIDFLCTELREPMGRLALLQDNTLRLIEVASPEEKDEEPEVAAQETAWIEIHLNDEDGNPVPGVQYELVCPDGSTRHGRSNEAGAIYYSGLNPGECKFKILDLDTSMWEQE